MANRKISRKRAASSIKDIPIIQLKKGLKTTKHDPTKNLTKPEFITQALAQCLLDGDKEEFMKVLLTHWKITNESETFESVDLARQTFYDLKITANPRLDVIIKLIKELKVTRR